MYGQIDSEPMAHTANEPPVKASNMPNMPPAWLFARAVSIADCRAIQSMPGVGIREMRRQTATRPSVMRIFLRSSGILKALEKPVNIDIWLFSEEDC